MKKSFFLCLALMVVSVGRADNLTISSVGKLKEFQQQVNDGDDFSGCTVTLASDLDLEGIDWIPIGTTGKPFRGTFDGQGHWISNLLVNIDGAQTGDVAGLFGCIDVGARVMRIGIQSGEIRISQKSYPDVECFMGGIVGLCRGAVSQCANQATVYGNQTFARVGGIAGKITEDGTVEDCYNLGRLYTSKTYEDSNYLGGIAGICDDGTICRVYVSASIESGSTVNTDGIVPMLGYFEIEPEAAFYDDGETDMLGFALDGKLNTTEGDYSVWSFAEGRLPLLTCFSEQTQPTAGDVNDDGQVNVSDVTALVTIILGGNDSEPHIYNHKAADVNADNAVNVSDVTALVTIILGLN